MDIVVAAAAATAMTTAGATLLFKVINLILLSPYGSY